MQTSSFSFQKLRDAGNTPLAPLESLPASDGVTLRYRLYAPVEPQAVVLFYHGGGAHHGHDYAVRFNSPPQLLKTDPGLVSAIIITMSNALIPAATGDQFEALDRPFGLWIGEEDELFLPEKVLAFADREQGPQDIGSTEHSGCQASVCSGKSPRDNRAVVAQDNSRQAMNAPQHGDTV